MQSWCIGWNFCKHTGHNQSHFLLEYTSWFIWKINYKHYFCYMQHVRKIFMLKLGLSKPCSVAQCFYFNVCWITHMKSGQRRHNVIYEMKYNTCDIAYSNEMFNAAILCQQSTACLRRAQGEMKRQLNIWLSTRRKTNKPVDD